MSLFSKIRSFNSALRRGAEGLSGSSFNSEKLSSSLLIVLSFPRLFWKVPPSPFPAFLGHWLFCLRHSISKTVFLASDPGRAPHCPVLCDPTQVGVDSALLMPALGSPLLLHHLAASPTARVRGVHLRGPWGCAPCPRAHRSASRAPHPRKSPGASHASGALTAGRAALSREQGRRTPPRPSEGAPPQGSLGRNSSETFENCQIWVLCPSPGLSLTLRPFGQRVVAGFAPPAHLPPLRGITAPTAASPQPEFFLLVHQWTFL